MPDSDARPALWITGLGVVSPLGVGRAALAEAVRTSRVGIGDLTLFEPLGSCEHAAEVTDYDWKDYLFSKQSYADRCTQLALGAARLALEDAGLDVPVDETADPVGLCFGTCWGCLESAARFYEPIAHGKGRTASSLVFSHSYPNCPTSFAAIELGLRGYSTSFAGSPLAGLWALRSAADALAQGGASCVLAGAADGLGEVVWAHLAASGGLPATQGRRPNEEEAADWARVPGEAAVFLCVETEARARARAAEPLARIEDVVEEGANGPVDWSCGNTHAAGPLLALARALVSHADATIAVADDGGSLTVRLARV